MALINLKKFGGYKVLVKCPNCGFDSEITVTKGISVQDFVNGGKCKCDNCQVVFFPEDYTTEHFQNKARRDKPRGDMGSKLSNLATKIKNRPNRKPKTLDLTESNLKW